jgi:starvation-inducible DNA-binding protein
MEDNKAFGAHLRKAHKVCDDSDEVATASILEVYIDETERRTWFLFEIQEEK